MKNAHGFGRIVAAGLVVATALSLAACASSAGGSGDPAVDEARLAYTKDVADKQAATPIGQATSTTGALKPQAKGYCYSDPPYFACCYGRICCTWDESKGGGPVSCS